MDEAERRKTMELLWRLETGEGVLSDESDDDAHDSGDDPPEDLLGRLSLADQQRFQSLLRDPARAARMYFEDEEEVPLWWTEQAKPCDNPPFLREVEVISAAQVPVRVDLRFNIVAVLMAYAYLLRHLQLPSCASVDRPVECGSYTDSDGATKPIVASASIVGAEQGDKEPKRPAEPVEAADYESDGEPPPLEDDTPEAPVEPPAAPRQDTPHPSLQNDTPERHEDTPDELQEVGVSLLRRLVPFLFAHPRKDPKAASTVLTSVEDAGLYLLHTLGPDRMGADPVQLLLVLLRDVDPLLRPSTVRDVRDVPLPVYALADLDTWLHPERGAAKKLAFYAHAYQAAPREAHSALHVALQNEQQRLEQEHDERERLLHVAAANAAVGRMDPQVQRMSSKIQVLE